MRSYNEFCSLARALDVVGDRWTLLIVRELLLRGPCRYTDLQHGLPGIATNLLADRLRELERAGLISREEAPPPVATTLFKLTARGEDLRAVISALAQWGVPLMAEPIGDAAFRNHWLQLPIGLFLADPDPASPPSSIELRTEDGPATIELGGGEVRTRPGAADDPQFVLSGSAQLILGVIGGMLTLEDARGRGLEYAGDPGALARVQKAATSEARRV